MKAAPKTIDGGFVVVFEGIDGVGKTTQLGLVREELEKDRWAVHPTRNLGGTPIGEALREVTLSSTPRSVMTDFYISVAIQTAMAEAVAADRKEGKITLIDRGPLSFAAYHMYGSGVDQKVGWRYVDQGMKQFKPDLVILYNADLKVALGRAKRRAGKADYFASKPESYFQRVLAGFKAAKERYPVCEIDAAQDIDSVHAETMR
ncbi:MAG TPA: dTMP kinase, partial [Candidatus Saccharimonadales bacterium]|nr:dTMP kinase [Candidatus Saccharimonadales bacterium]